MTFFATTSNAQVILLKIVFTFGSEVSLTLSTIILMLDIPDLATRSGLKKIHVNFDTFYNRINSFYEVSCNNYKVKGGIIAPLLNVDEA